MTRSPHSTTGPEHCDHRTPAQCCEHAWAVESRHTVMNGVVLYQKCVRCGTRRIDRWTPGEIVPRPSSREVTDSG